MNGLVKAVWGMRGGGRGGVVQEMRFVAKVPKGVLMSLERVEKDPYRTVTGNGFGKGPAVTLVVSLKFESSRGEGARTGCGGQW